MRSAINYQTLAIPSLAGRTGVNPNFADDLFHDDSSQPFPLVRRIDRHIDDVEIHRAITDDAPHAHGNALPEDMHAIAAARQPGLHALQRARGHTGNKA